MWLYFGGRALQTVHARMILLSMKQIHICTVNKCTSLMVRVNFRWNQLHVVSWAYECGDELKELIEAEPNFRWSWRCVEGILILPYSLQLEKPQFSIPFRNRRQPSYYRTRSRNAQNRKYRHLLEERSWLVFRSERPRQKYVPKKEKASE